jgi:uncharacterized protein (TIGR02145 family)
MKTSNLVSSLFFILISISFYSCDTEGNTNEGNSDITFKDGLTYGTITDQEGNTYKTIQIGDQVWMAENLRTTKYNDGTSIPLVTDIESITTMTTPAYMQVNNKVDKDSILLYGRLYNFHAVNTGKLAPVGWHVATYADWNKLMTFAGGENTAGGKMKETGNKHWKAENNASNETGFTAIPAGYATNIAYAGMKNFEAVGTGAYFWQKDNFGSQTAATVYVWYNTTKMSRSTGMKYQGLSVRCVKD